MAENDILLILYRKEYSRYLFLKKELKELTEKALQTKQEEDYVRFQLEQLTDAGLVAGEQEELEQELETLSHAEEIKGSLYKITQLLDGGRTGSRPTDKRGPFHRRQPGTLLSESERNSRASAFCLYRYERLGFRDGSAQGGYRI